MQGQPFVFLPFVHHALLGFSTEVATFVTEHGFDLYAKTDYRFMESVFKLLVTQFDYKAALNIQQFFQTGFSEQKMAFCRDICRLMKQKHESLAKLNMQAKFKVVRHQPIEAAPTPTPLPLPFVDYRKEVPTPVARPELTLAPKQSENTEILNMLRNLGDSVRSLGSRFDAYTREVDDRFTKINAEMTLLRNKVDMIDGARHSIKTQEPTPMQISPQLQVSQTD
jgi:centrosomal protein CEP44